MSRVIQVFLRDAETQTYDLWVCATEIRGGHHYSKQETLRSAASIQEVKEELPGLLKSAFKTVSGWCSEDLKPAGPVPDLKDLDLGRLRRAQSSRQVWAAVIVSLLTLLLMRLSGC